MENEKLLYREVQTLTLREISMVLFYPNHGPIILLILALFAIFLGSFWGVALGIVIIAVIVGNLVYLLRTELITEVYENGIYLLRKPSQPTPQYIPTNSIKSCWITNPSLMRISIDALGWFKWGLWGKYYFLNPGSKDQCVEIALKEGRTLLVGSDKPKELKQAIDALLESPSAAPE